MLRQAGNPARRLPDRVVQAAREQYEAIGVPFDRPGVRIDRLLETLAVLRACFGDGLVDPPRGEGDARIIASRIGDDPAYGAAVTTTVGATTACTTSARASSGNVPMSAISTVYCEHGTSDATADDA